MYCNKRLQTAYDKTRQGGGTMPRRSGGRNLSTTFASGVPSLNWRRGISIALLAVWPLNAVSALAAWKPSTVLNGDAPMGASGMAGAGQDSGFGPLDSSAPAGITPEEIVTKLGARETEFAKARDEYEFKQTVRTNTISEDTGRPDGEFFQVSMITFTEDDRRLEKVLLAPANTIERVIMTEADFDEIQHRQPFVLTAADLPNYQVTYLGRQKVDELDTYVFEAGPKEIKKGKRYFQGKVWVDQQDFQIVLINGKTVPQDTRRGHEDLQPPFTTYYEQVDGKYWFPTYTKAEGTLHFAAQSGALSQDVHMRSTVKYTDYKRYHFHAKSRVLDANGNVIAGPEDDAGKASKK
jgi:hypothetical protein